MRFALMRRSATSFAASPFAPPLAIGAHTLSIANATPVQPTALPTFTRDTLPPLSAGKLAELDQVARRSCGQLRAMAGTREADPRGSVASSALRVGWAGRSTSAIRAPTAATPAAT